MTGDTQPGAGEGRGEVPQDGDWLLVTNDDGVDSPALRPLLRSLGALAPVRAVVPVRELSWSAKTLSRFARLRLQAVAETDLPAELHTLDGSPADCASVGIHNLMGCPPRLVVSGVNIGANAGTAYLLSSGTVGAAVESSLSGVPAVAFSLQLHAADYARWRHRRDLAGLDAGWQRAAEVAAEITAEILAGGLPEGAQLMSVNLPPGADRDTPRVLTGVTETSYGPFFRRAADGRLEHVDPRLTRTGADGQGDLEALDRGRVAITPLSFRLDVSPTPRDRARFERR